MQSKVILFRHRSAAGPYACADGEIESSVNARLVPTSASYVSDYGYESSTDAATTDDSASDAPDIDRFNRLSRRLPLVEFSLMPTPLAGWQNHPANPPFLSVEAPKSKDAEGWALRAAETLAGFHAEAERQKLFTEPFLALAALRLRNGSHTLPSSPVLLMPNQAAPAVEGSADLSLDSMTMYIQATVCRRLRIRVTLPVPSAVTSTSSNEAGGSEAELSGITDEYAGLVEAVDIFVSSPIPLYDHDAPLSAMRHAAGSASTQSWQPLTFTDNEFTARLLSSVSFRAVSSLPLSDLPGEWTDITFNIPDFSRIPACADDPRLKELLSYTPDYFRHHGISGTTACTFSGITTLTDLTLTLPTPPPLATLIPDASENQNHTNVALEIESLKNGQTLRSYAYDPAWPQAAISDSAFPSWLFIPDPDACQLSLITPEAIYVVPLRRHPILDGAFYWCGTPKTCDISQTGVKKLAATVILPTEKTLRRDSWRQPGTIRISGNRLSLTAAEVERLSRAPVMISPIDPSCPVEIVTRPLKLAAVIPESQAKPGVFSSITQTLRNHWHLRLIGPFTGTPRLSFQGSRDLVHWHPLASSGSPSLHSCQAQTLTIPACPALPYGRLVISGPFSGHIEAFALIFHSSE